MILFEELFVVKMEIGRTKRVILIIKKILVSQNNQIHYWEQHRVLKEITLI